MLAVVASSIYGRSVSALRRGTRPLQEGFLQNCNDGKGGDRPPLLALRDALQAWSRVAALGAPQWGRLLSSSSGKAGDGSGKSDGEAPAGEGPHVVEGEGSTEEALKEAVEKGGNEESKGGTTLLDRLNPFKRSASKKDSKETISEQEIAAEKGTAVVKEIVLEKEPGEVNGAEKESPEAPQSADGEPVVSAAMVPSSPRPENFPEVLLLSMRSHRCLIILCQVIFCSAFLISAVDLETRLCVEFNILYGNLKF